MKKRLSQEKIKSVNFKSHQISKKAGKEKNVLKVPKTKKKNIYYGIR